MIESEVKTPSNPNPLNELDVLQQIISALSPLSDEARRRIMESVATFLGIELSKKPDQSMQTSGSMYSPATASVTAFSEDTSMSPKEFLLEKRPKTDVERIACLAYYLTRYRETPYFKTLDLSKLNLEAAQPKFANSANASNNAVKMGYLVHATKGQRQLSAFGEQFVRALPDREAAKEAARAFRRRPRSKKPKSRSEEKNDNSQVDKG